MVRTPFQIAGSGPEVIPEGAGSGREAIMEGREWSGGPPGGPGQVERPTWRARSGPEVIPEGQEWS